MKIGDFVKIDHKYMSPPTAKRYNNNPMGVVIWVWGTSQIWAKVVLVDGHVLTFPAQCMDLAWTDSVLDKTSEPDTLLPYPGDAV